MCLYLNNPDPCVYIQYSRYTDPLANFYFADYIIRNETSAHHHGRNINSAHLHTDFDGGDVCYLIDVLHSGVVHLPVVELHADASLIGHNVSVGNNETIIGDYEPRAIGQSDFSSRKRVSAQKNIDVSSVHLMQSRSNVVLI